MKERVTNEIFWQNEVLSQTKSFLGFVDSLSQKTTNDKQTLTAYYCFDESERAYLMDVEKQPDLLVNETIKRIGEYIGDDISAKVEKVFVKVMGHAMPIPYPGYLFNDQNENRSEKNLVYAGVDNSRLPLLYEALDSGIEASKLIYN
jgi:hypothetical protein